MMLGKVTFTIGGSPAAAILDDDGRWRIEADDEAVATVLADDLNSDLTTEGYSPADGRLGAMLIDEAARRLEGEPWMPDQPESPPGLVY